MSIGGGGAVTPLRPNEYVVGGVCRRGRMRILGVAVCHGGRMTTPVDNSRCPYNGLLTRESSTFACADWLSRGCATMWGLGVGRRQSPRPRSWEVEDSTFWCVRVGRLSLFSHALLLPHGVPPAPAMRHTGPFPTLRSLEGWGGGLRVHMFEGYAHRPPPPPPPLPKAGAVLASRGARLRRPLPSGVAV